MKKYIGLIIGIIAFVAVIAGAGVLYSKLSEDYGVGQNLMVNNATEPNVTTSTDAVEESTEQTTEQNAEEPTEEPVEPEKIMAIDFTVEDAAGEQVNLFSLVGKPMVLNFWASWCGPCKSELPDFQAAYEKYGEDVEFVIVNMTDGVRETKEIATAFLEEQGYTLPVYFDTEQDAAYTYGVYSLPTTYFVAADGELVAGAQGMIDAETLEYGISLIYSGE